MPRDDYMVPDSAPEIVDAPAEQSLPANIDAERTIIGAVLLDNAAFNEAAENLEPDDFSLDSHRRIFLRMAELMDVGQAVDIVTLAHELNRRKEIESIGGVAYLASLTEGLPLRPVIVDYLRIVKDKSRLRKLMLVCSNVIARAADQSETSLAILEDTEGQLLQIAQDAVSGKLRTVAESIQVAGGVDAYMAPIVNPVEKTGLLTKFEDYDSMTGGLQKGELTVIAARPSMGKTGLITNIFENICYGTEKVAALFSLEMSRESMERRILASLARVDIQRAMTGKYLSNLEKEKLHHAMGPLVEMNLYIDDTAAMTPTQMRAKARRLKQRMGRLDVVGVDYLQLMSGGGRFQNRQEEVSHISRSLKQMSKELDCPVIALAQLNRGNEARQDKRPILSDLRESGQLEQDADVVAFVHREDYYERDPENKTNIADVIVAKQRNGPTGIVRLVFMSSLVKFDNLAR